MPGPSSDRPITLVYFVGQLGLGGSERQLYLLLKHLDGARFERHVVVFNPSPYLVLNDALKACGVQVYEVPQQARTVSARLRYLYGLGRRLAPDIVHSWTVHDNPYAGLVGRLLGSRHLGALRGSRQLPSFQRLPRLFRYLSLHSVSTLVVNAEVIARELKADGYPASKIFVLPNCVEPPPEDLEAVDLADLGIDAQPVVGIVGNLRRVKNHRLFIEGMAEVGAAHPEVRGLIAGQPVPGEPEAPGDLAAAIAERGLEGRVVLAGFRGDVPALMRRFSIVCLTSISEGMPNVLLEAMAAGRPVVATRVGGVPELVEDGVNGLLIESGDVAGFVRAVKRLLADPVLARRMGAAGREKAQRRFGCWQMARRLAQFYLEILGQASPRGFEERQGATGGNQSVFSG